MVVCAGLRTPTAVQKGSRRQFSATDLFAGSQSQCRSSSALLPEESRHGIPVIEEHVDPVDQIDPVEPEEKQNVPRIASTGCVERHVDDAPHVILTNQPVIELRFLAAVELGLSNSKLEGLRGYP
jgi:hypothetical protein